MSAYNKLNLQFQECESCSAKPGAPILCKGCLHNREVISKLLARKNQSSRKIRSAHARKKVIKVHKEVHDGSAD